MKRKTCLKSKYSCSHCTRILKDPLSMPCNDDICADHLKERNLMQVKCLKCNEIFDIKNTIFKSNLPLKKLLSGEFYLSDEEKRLKQQIEIKIRDFHQNKENFNQNKCLLDMDCYNYFQELRRQIDLHREEEMPKVYNILTMKRIDDISIQMIERIQIFEENYLSKFKVEHENSLKTLQEDLEDLTESFREYNLTFDLIERIKLDYETNIDDLKSKLNDMLQIKVDWIYIWWIYQCGMVVFVTFI